MGARVSRSDFEYVYTDEPHATRRKIILAKYPQIKDLMIVDTNFKWIVTAIVVFQSVSFYLLKDVTSFWILFPMAYFITGTINHWLSFALHEIAHNQPFGNKYPTANKLFGIFANLPMGIPASVTFKKYHAWHHRNLADPTLDTDVPTEFEGRFFNTSGRKVIWFILQPLFYMLRPLMVHPQPFAILEIANIVVQIAFNVLIGVTLGWHITFLMVGSTLLSFGLHPMAGRFISDHFITAGKVKSFEELKEKLKNNGIDSNGENNEGNGIGTHLIPDTTSYYGPLNWLAFNEGYHVEHHDFPSIPGSLLPKVRQIAPEFYYNLYQHSSWPMLVWQYIFDPSLGPYARVNRISSKKN